MGYFFTDNFAFFVSKSAKTKKAIFSKILLKKFLLYNYIKSKKETIIFKYLFFYFFAE
jgi:hypothetical protein